jgi:catechol 2,3-dioxygenase-like lactoylglutathione lyase family enzyme
VPDPSTVSPDSGEVGPAVLDHVAIAVERWADAWPRYAVGLGGTWSSGGFNIGFGPAQLRFANDARLEVLQPWQPESNPFLRRFLDASGPGPHHLTFKVADLGAALDVVRARGFDPVGVDRTDPTWQEAFLHPRQAMGIVVQLAQAAGEWMSPSPEGFPTALRRPPASLVHVAHAVDDLDRALLLFRDLLGGTVRTTGIDRTGVTFVDLSWSGPLSLRLVGPEHAGDEPLDGGPVRRGPLVEHLAGRPGRVHHLRFSLPDASSVAGAVPVGSAADAARVGIEDVPAWVVAPDANLGARLVLVEGR